MQMLKRYIAACCLWMVCMATGTKALHAQDSSGVIKTWMQQLQQRYHDAGYLGFHIKYLYTNAGPSAVALDSLTGEVEMHGNQCRLVIDSTETVVTARYTIQVRPEEKMIVLSGARPSGNLDPIGLMDSLLAHTGNVHARISHQPGQDVLTISFPPGREYSSVRIVTDTRTGWLQRISYTLPTAGLVAPDMISSPGHPAPYQAEGRIDMLFSHYRRGGFNKALFSESNYFNKTDGRYEAAARYKDYRIFLASSNL